MDANGILNVSAKENSTGKSKNIVIKNDKGRLSQAEIEKMLSDAEKYKHEDDEKRERVASRNKLESYAYGVKQAIDEAGSKLKEPEASTARRKCEETIRWLDSNSLAEKDEYEDKLNELTNICAPLMKKLHGAGQKSQGGSDGPVIEEVD